MEQLAGLRGFVQRPLGRVLLIAFAILVTAFTYAYLYALLAIPVMLVVGLAVPIWLGIKRIRFLALLGLVILLLSAPIANVVLTQEVMTPIAPANSPTDFVGGGGGALMQNAQVSPYVGGLATNFTWTVSIVPLYVPKGNDTPFQISLYISTCPGATGANDLNCAVGYPFYTQNQTLKPADFANDSNHTVTFHFIFPSDSIWAWQMGLFLNNSTSPTTHNATFILLVGDPNYNGLEGPVVGTFATTYIQLLLTVYINILVYLGIPFYVVLLVYMYIKRRQTQRGSALARSPGPIAPEAGETDAPVSPAPRTAAPAVAEVAGPRRPEVPCPNCGAVVYPNETTCWKCGATLSPSASAPTSTPLPSAPKKN
ncbi:MAG TPA: hypothetical protein VK424_05795 [Thermoplasmata archaeon]|nr:hypothetical protein [Thermoplasmata archaeon]